MDTGFQLLAEQKKELEPAYESMIKRNTLRTQARLAAYAARPRSR